MRSCEDFIYLGNDEIVYVSSFGEIGLFSLKYLKQIEAVAISEHPLRRIARLSGDHFCCLDVQGRVFRALIDKDRSKCSHDIMEGVGRIISIDQIYNSSNIILMNQNRSLLKLTAAQDVQIVKSFIIANINCCFIFDKTKQFLLNSHQVSLYDLV